MTRGPDPDHSDEEILFIFAVSPDPCLFAIELTETLDMTRQGVYKRLDKLVEQGLLLTKKPGEKTRVYWISRAGKQRLQESSGSQ
jgi:DNA-binding MarR family transcriptional regulator